MITKKKIVALIIHSVFFAFVVGLSYFWLKTALKKKKSAPSSDAQEPATSFEMNPPSKVISILARNRIRYDMSDLNKTPKNESLINISPNVLVEDESGLSNEDSNVSISTDYQESALLESPSCLFEENEEIEVSSKNQNDLEKEVQAEKAAQSEVENMNFEASEEEITGQETEMEVQPDDALENTVTLENDVETKPEVSSHLDVAAIPAPKPVCNLKNVNIPTEVFELPCGYFKSARGNVKILPGILITFYNAGSMEIPEEILEKFDIENFISWQIPLDVEKCFLNVPSGIYETLGGEYEFEDGSSFLIPKGVKIHVPEKTIIEYPKGLDMNAVIELAFDCIKKKKKTWKNKNWKQARKTRNGEKSEESTRSNSSEGQKL